MVLKVCLILAGKVVKSKNLANIHAIKTTFVSDCTIKVVRVLNQG